MAALRGVGDAGEAQLLIDVGGKDSALQSAGHHRGGQEQPLVQGGHQPQVGAHLLAQSRGGEPVGTPVHALLGAADVAADGGKSSAGVLDEAAHHHVGPQIRGPEKEGRVAYPLDRWMVMSLVRPLIFSRMAS
ncbi:Uncharacterised protein [uncultured Blautia sp.]|nr:Uncharacterised protein [uncultured Blautia sp.]